MKYLAGYSAGIQQQVQQLIEKDKLQHYLLQRYPTAHDFSSNDQLYRYGQDLKQRYMKKAPPLKKIAFDPKVSVIHHALGLNAHITRAHGGKLKASHEIRIDPCFKRCPEAFLRMILVHELAHLKERDHNKSFYQLCQHMEPDYFQLELDLRLMLTWQDTEKKALY
ncbi:MAG: YgjP-like metallopeptidase domain-containing protein [Oceanospirillum sp.]|nr:YgjP-like metallopeptidase domain-containing protein [Oceanospirillum sp.]